MTGFNEVTIQADDENNADLFWSLLRRKHPEIARELEAGPARVSLEKWQEIQAIDGFSDGPDYAKTALIVVG